MARRKCRPRYGVLPGIEPIIEWAGGNFETQHRTPSCWASLPLAANRDDFRRSLAKCVPKKATSMTSGKNHQHEHAACTPEKQSAA
jgi:hypothetical protein